MSVALCAKQNEIASSFYYSQVGCYITRYLKRYDLTDW